MGVSFPMSSAGGVGITTADQEGFCEDEIALEIVGFSVVFSNELPRELTVDDVDFSRARKFYVDVNIFDIETDVFFQMAYTLENIATILFEVPVYFENGDVYVANVHRRNPIRMDARELLSEAELANYEQGVGKWFVASMSQYNANSNPYVDYYEVLAETISATGKFPLLVGSLPYFRSPVAIFPDEEGSIKYLIPLSAHSLSWYGLGVFEKEFDQNGWLEYSKVKEYINTHPLEVDSELTGGGGGNTSNNTEFIWWIPVVLVIGLGSLSCILVLGKIKRFQ